MPWEHVQVSPRSNSFAAATRVKKLDSDTYEVCLAEAFCIGNVPSGGYTASCMLAAANLHLSERGQTDTLAAHFEYPSRAAPGVAIIKIEDIKLGGQISTLHVTLWQGGIIPQTPWVRPGESRRVVLAYTTHTHLASLSGVTLPTGFESSKAGELPGLPDFELLNTSSHGTDGTWRLAKLPAVARTIARSLAQWSLYLPCQGPLSPGVLDMWMRLSSGERITQGALAYVVDSFPYNLHEFLAAPQVRDLLLASRPEEVVAKTEQEKEIEAKGKQRGAMWFPTIVLNLEVKAVLPKSGVEWLAIRVSSKQIKDGRFDLEVSVRDTEGEMVALSHHVAMILTMERNTKKAKASL